MKLTKTQRAEFVQAVMADLPRPAMKARRAAIQRFQDDCLHSLPASVLKVYRQYPKMFNRESFQLSGFLVPYGSRNTYPDYGNHVYTPVVDAGKLPLEPDFSTHMPYLAECQAANTLEKRLTEVVGDCLTLAELKSALPEFEKYMPKVPEKVVRSLPTAAGGLVADICKFGHPVCAAKPKAKKG